MSDVTALYYFEPRSDTTPKFAAQAIADEETTGTWTDLTTRTDYTKRLDGRVESVEPEGSGYLTKIAYPAEIFEPGNIPQYLSVVAGNLFGLGRLNSVRLLDIFLPEELVRFKGPKFGIEGVRKLIGTDKSRRPHVGTIIKPKVGLNPKDTAEVAYLAATGGVDFIKDDETLTDQAFCPLNDRVEAVMAGLDKAMAETGRTILYAANVSTRADKIVERAEKVIECGANAIMVDVITCGFSAVQALAEEPSIKVPVHVHRTMHAAMTRNKKHGIAMRPIARLVRMAGGDQLHTGTVSGKMGHDPAELLEDNNILKEKWYSMKPVFPVASGGLHPGKVNAELSRLGNDIILQAGGGIHGHPEGTKAGAMAMRQAVDAFMEGVTAEEYAKNHRELRLALEKWGK
ncbi:ribulose-bisphosphate carboxylase large chain [Methanomicrobium sp. W14]|uniref:RuBisCO large subunit C-terminal-like domain-containing protein n=1 Tax=Methanomicrobium sp. W14 TaxID=2817839 RepID=UPI001AE6500E|nr:RuBisCO large subunit C-terminal-like domain-containing protein [Methanomicrobium sp. W14]MBP2132910.1 ribulose-bisphosphate carboxylase large chain [Methanomicrobium sp. W14]